MKLSKYPRRFWFKVNLWTHFYLWDTVFYSRKWTEEEDTSFIEHRELSMCIFGLEFSIGKCIEKPYREEA